MPPPLTPKPSTATPKPSTATSNPPTAAPNPTAVSNPPAAHDAHLANSSSFQYDFATAVPSTTAAQTTAAPPAGAGYAPAYSAHVISNAYLNPVVPLIPVSTPSVHNGTVNYGLERYLRLSFELT